MNRYKIRFIYTDYSDTIHEQRVKGHDFYEADNAQDAVDQCRKDFYISDQMDIVSVYKWSLLGNWMPVSETAWI